MRIIAGEFRGRSLEAPPGTATRPTADRVREALFSMIASRLGSLEGLRVADLYAGSGALGLEALSRGASHVTFVENAPGARATIERNAGRLGVGDRIRLVGGSALALPASGPFDLVLADPPYQLGSGSAVVEAVARAGWLAPGGWMSVETARGDPVDPRSYEIHLERDVGRARLTLLNLPSTASPRLPASKLP